MTSIGDTGPVFTRYRLDTKMCSIPHPYCLVGFVFKCTTLSIHCSSTSGYQTALHYCGRPLLDWWLIACIRCKAMNRVVRTVTVRYEYMYRATPNIYVYISFDLYSTVDTKCMFRFFSVFQKSTFIFNKIYFKCIVVFNFIFIIQF